MQQRGLVLLSAILLLLVVSGYVLLKNLNTSRPVVTQAVADAQTIRALAEAKAALIGFAASVYLDPTSHTCEPNCPRPGDLPCPDLNNNGKAESSCGSPDGFSGTSGKCDTPATCLRLGRLPWKTLGLGDLRDGSGERLWYAVSTHFKNNTRNPCSKTVRTGCLNSDTRGTITVGNPDGSLLHDGTLYVPTENRTYLNGGAIAVVIAPGTALATQARDCPGNCLLASNYLDVGQGENNATFAEVPSSAANNGFIQGTILDASGTVIVNDRILPISYQDLMPALERRVAGEVANCVRQYGIANQSPVAVPPDADRYPWANKVPDLDYSSDSPERFGRLPDPLFGLTAFSMSDSWPAVSDNCFLGDGFDWGTNWWLNWKEHVFYAIANRHKPRAPSSPPLPPGNCLAILPFGDEHRKFVVVLPGRPLETPPPPQSRTGPNKLVVTSYLESDNTTPANDTYGKTNPTDTYNDVIVDEGGCP